MNRFQGATGTMYLRGVPKTIRDRFNAMCALRGKTMKKVLIEFMTEFGEKGRHQLIAPTRWQVEDDVKTRKERARKLKKVIRK